MNKLQKLAKKIAEDRKDDTLVVHDKTLTTLVEFETGKKTMIYINHSTGKIQLYINYMRILYCKKISHSLCPRSGPMELFTTLSQGKGYARLNS